MLSQHATIFRRLMIFTDLCIAAGAFLLAYYVRNRDDAFCPMDEMLWFLVLFVALWGVTLSFSGIYSSFRLKRIKEVLFIIYQSAYLSFFIFAGLCYALRIDHISRIFVFLAFIFTMFFLALEKIILVQVFRYLRKKGFNYRNVLIVGTEERARRLVESMDKNREFGLHIIGFVDEDKNMVGQTIVGHKVLGTWEDIPQIHRDNALDQVLFVVPHASLGRIEKPMSYLETVGVKVDIAMDYFSLKIAKAKQSEFFDIPFLTFESTPVRVLPMLIKRFADIVLTTMALIVLAPLFLVVALLVKVTSKGPVFFVQKRGSLNGRKFNLYKFRTMVADAESRIKELEAYNEMKGAAFKIKNDPRVTPLGKWLRKFSIDELPQLWNVFRGEMSLVGPRPPLLREVEQYDDWHRRKLSMRPGITCLWQVNGRNKITDFSQWAELDLKYIDNWSLWLDFKILLKTVPVVLFGIGAK